MLQRLMDRYRGTPGIVGWIVFRLDVRALKRAHRLLLEECRRQGLLTPSQRPGKQE